MCAMLNGTKMKLVLWIFASNEHGQFERPSRGDPDVSDVERGRGWNRIDGLTKCHDIDVRIIYCDLIDALGFVSLKMLEKTAQNRFIRISNLTHWIVLHTYILFCLFILIIHIYDYIVVLF